jgi:polyhydroxyalkanoate synthesis regulator phasin
MGKTAINSQKRLRARFAYSQLVATALERAWFYATNYKVLGYRFKNKGTSDAANAGGQWLELANDVYHTYIRSLVSGQERAMELTRFLIGQAESFQNEGKGLVEEYAKQVQQAQQLLQSVVQGNIKSGTELVNQYRQTGETTISEMNARVEALQARLTKK